MRGDQSTRRIQDAPVGGFRRGEIALGLLSSAERRARSRAASSLLGLFRERQRVVPLVFPRANRRESDRRPCSGGVGGNRRFGALLRRRRSPQVLEQREAAQSLALLRPGGLLCGGGVRIDGQIDVVLSLEQSAQAERCLARGILVRSRL